MANFDEMATVVGDNGYNYYKGYNGNDVYYTKGGPDRVKDYWGDDTYLYSSGDGWDEIYDSQGNDKIVLGEGFSKETTIFARYNNSLIIWLDGDKDKIDVIDWFNKDKNQIERIEFADGSYYTASDINDIYVDSTSNTEPPDIGDPQDPPDDDPQDPPDDDPQDPPDDPQDPPDDDPQDPPDDLPEDDEWDSVATLVGDDAYNVFKGEVGNDVYYAKGGADAIKDYWGDDTYLYGSGDGYDDIYDNQGDDLIIFGKGISKSDLTFEKHNSSLIIWHNSGEGRIAVIDWFNNDKNKIEKMEFEDGSYYTVADVQGFIDENPPQDPPDDDPQDPPDDDPVIPPPSSEEPTITGTNGDDQITNNSGDDVYYLQRGNDSAKDYWGDDTYLFNKGDGSDTLTDKGGNDRIVFGEGISKSDVEVSQVYGNSLSITFSDSDDSITVIDHFAESGKNSVERIEFADGSYLTDDDINQMINDMSGFAAEDGSGIDTPEPAQPENLSNLIVNS